MPDDYEDPEWTDYIAWLEECHDWDMGPAPVEEERQAA